MVLDTKGRSKLVIRRKTRVSQFPLYDNLVEKIKTSGITEPNTKTWVKISQLDTENAQIIYYLILHYARINDNNDETPYIKKIPEGGKGAIYDVENIPLQLQLLLSLCIEEITA